MMTDEAGGKQTTEFVGLRARLHSYKTNEYEEKCAKGLQRV